MIRMGKRKVFDRGNGGVRGGGVKTHHQWEQMPNSRTADPGTIKPYVPSAVAEASIGAESDVMVFCRFVGGEGGIVNDQ